MSAAAETCTRCEGPLSPYAFTVPTMDGRRHEVCPVPPPTGDATSSRLELVESAGPASEGATLRRALLSVLSLASAAGSTIGATDAVAGIARVAREALAADVPGARATQAPGAIGPAVQRIRWLAARPSNALCNHPACHGGKEPCDEYRLRAARRATNPEVR